jgi:Rad3-related DNA helicase
MSYQSIDLVKHFPYSQARPVQQEALQLIQNNLDDYDVLVVNAPTALGKSAIAKSLMNGHRSVSAIAPTNLLVQQFLKEFPDTPTLSRLDSYRCEEWQRPCASTRAKLLKFCKGCKCGGDLGTAKFRKGPGIYNYHIYLAHKVFREILVIDEAHSLLPVIRDRMSITLWRHDYKYPHDMWRKDQVLAWISTLTPGKQKSKKIKLLKEAVTYQVPEYIFNRTKDWFNGKGTLRNEPEERDCIKLMPVDVAKAPPMFWPHSEVKKIILLSATIGPKDIEQMGLGGRRVCYITCKSPIPAGSRPIVPLSLMSVNRTVMGTEEGVRQLASYINKIAQDHIGIKGVVHVTYQLSNLLSNHLTDNRFLFHNRDNKTGRYLEFRNSNPDEGRILVACGLYEGMDLPEDAGRWQIIAKVPWPSLADPGIKHLADLDPEHYIWETMKTTMQGCGRICRTPEDYGTTFIVDSSFWRMMQDGSHLVPEWFREAIVPMQDVYNYRRQLGI